MDESKNCLRFGQQIVHFCHIDNRLLKKLKKLTKSPQMTTKVYFIDFIVCIRGRFNFVKKSSPKAQIGLKFTKLKNMDICR